MISLSKQAHVNRLTAVVYRTERVAEAAPHPLVRDCVAADARVATQLDARAATGDVVVGGWVDSRRCGLGVGSETRRRMRCGDCLRKGVS